MIGAISYRMVVLPSPKIVINLPQTYNSYIEIAGQRFARFIGSDRHTWHTKKHPVTLRISFNLYIEEIFKIIFKKQRNS